MDRLQENLRQDSDGEAEMASSGAIVSRRPELRLERYFEGLMRGHGVFQDRFGNLRQEFTVDTLGHWDGDIFLLEEDFRFRDGRRQRRQWRVRILDDRSYTATAGDIVGTARGERDGSIIRWRYTLAVPVGSRTINMRFDDRMFLQEDGVMINLSDASKWGVRLGRLAASFRAPG